MLKLLQILQNYFKLVQNWLFYLFQKVSFNGLNVHFSLSGGMDWKNLSVLFITERQESLDFVNLSKDSLNWEWICKYKFQEISTIVHKKSNFLFWNISYFLKILMIFIDNTSNAWLISKRNFKYENFFILQHWDKKIPWT